MSSSKTLLLLKMGSSMKVDELRDELSKRGLSTAGIKPTLVKRLETALRQEAKSTDGVDCNSVKACEIVEKEVGRKRERGEDNDDIIAIEKIREMNVKELREHATLRGISSTGTKKQLIERLCADALDDGNDDCEVNVKKDDKEEQVKKVEDDSKQLIDESGKIISEVEKIREMTLKELREQAILRGVSSTGTKKQLIDRLCADAVDDDDDDCKVKVEKGDKEEDDKNHIIDESDKIVGAVEKIEKMTVKELRELAVLRGVSSTGTKKQLIDRLCDVKAEKDDKEEEVKKEEVEKKEKLVTATKKGAAVLDQWLPDNIKNQYHVLQLGNDIYDAMLNQTNVGDNNNKFYVMQVLEMDGGGTFYVYNRWGRVGIKGQDKLFGPYTSRDSARDEFEKKFYAKTQNFWCNRKDFISHQKSYTWLEMDYTENEQATDEVKPCPSTSFQPRESKLESRVASFISLICNIGMMKQQMMEIGYNAEKLPLGKLSKLTISKGYAVLKRLSEVVGQANRKELEQLSGEFYTVIPHDFGFKKMREFVIDTPQKLKSKLEMVEALGEIELATKLLKEDTESEDDPLYSQYQRLNCNLMSLDADSEEFSMVVKYLKNTHGETHSNYTVDVAQVFKVSREGDNERFSKFASTKNRMLLWHGSRLTNWAGILSQGLRIAPPEAPVTGYMFGKGVYFADMFSKSANYCYANQSSRSGVLLLCEVALGDMEELLHSNYNADQLPKGKLSTKGVGRTAPDPSETEIMKDGVMVPFGKPREQKGRSGSLMYNEYIVYNVDQIRMRYLLQVNFNFKR